MTAGFTMAQIAHLLLNVILLAIGQVLLKIGADRADVVTDMASFVRLLSGPVILLALVLYGVTTVLWVYTLQQVPLSRAYPFTALGFVMVPLASFLVLREPVNLSFALGVLFILVGLYFIVQSR